ncbi:hypothetical protein QL285_025521 [Trifolium repens]|nr:hypothetical protein QL285_092060 [Trifolium repens]KAK2426899.1 hypothetical protein QL285_025521 [Trifolium repens]
MTWSLLVRRKGFWSLSTDKLFNKFILKLSHDADCQSHTSDNKLRVVKKKNHFVPFTSLVEITFTYFLPWFKGIDAP